VVLIGATTVRVLLLALPLVALVLVMLLTESTSNSCKNFLAAPQPMERHLVVSSPAQLLVMIKDLRLRMSSHGSVGPPELLLHGRSVAMTEALMIVALLLLEDPLLLGQEIVVVVMATETPTTMLKVVVTTPPLVVMLLHGNSQLLLIHQLLHTPATLPQVILVAILLNKPWALHLALQRLQD